MSKIIDIIRRTTPEDSTYGDDLSLMEGGVELWRGPCSTHPNPFQPATKKPWYDVYAQIAEGVFGWQFNPAHPKFGRCCLINGGAAIPTVNPNANHRGKYYATEVFLHAGDSETWRGSKACLTIPPSAAAVFFGLFVGGETGKITIRKVV
jgi:hypothetical protein